MNEMIKKTITIALKPDLMVGDTAEIEAECIGCLAVHPVYRGELGGYTVTHIPTGLTIAHHPDKWQCLGLMMHILTEIPDIDVVTADAIKNRDPKFYPLAEIVHQFNDEEWKLDLWKADTP